MSNSYEAKRTMKLDTAIDIDGVYLVDGFTYYPAAKNNDLVLNDANGDEIWTIRAVAGAPNKEGYAIEQKKYEAKPRKCRGLYLATIDGGVLYVHLSDKSPLA